MLGGPRRATVREASRRAIEESLASINFGTKQLYHRGRKRERTGSACQQMRHAPMSRAGAAGASATSSAAGRSPMALRAALRRGQQLRTAASLVPTCTSAAAAGLVSRSPLLPARLRQQHWRSGLGGLQLQQQLLFSNRATATEQGVTSSVAGAAAGVHGGCMHACMQ